MRREKIIGDQDLNLVSPEYRRKIASLSVFYRLHIGECAQELYDTFLVDVLRVRTKLKSSLLMRTARDGTSCWRKFFRPNMTSGPSEEE